MDFTLTQYFPTGLDRLWAAFGRPEYPQRKYRALGATAFRLQRFLVTAQTIDVELERDVPVDLSRLPPWVRGLVGGTQILRHRTRWQRVGPRRVNAELDISPRSLPVRARGVGSIVEIERLFADQVRTALDDDHEFTLKYLRQMAPA